jgi:Arc/MetJ family transcription regulator
MATNLNLNDALIDEAVRLGHHESKREAVDTALREYVAYLKRVDTIKRFGAIDFDDQFDHKKARAAR